MPPLPTSMPTFGVAEFNYLGAVIGLIVAYYLGSIMIITVCMLFVTRRDYTRTSTVDTNGWSVERNVKKITNEFFYGFRFEASYLSFNKQATYILLTTRVSSFLFYLTVPCIWRYVHERGNGWYYFTIWNVNLITIYFCLASAASVVGVLKGTPFTTFTSNNWKPLDLSLGIAVQIFFTVAAPTACFVTIFYYNFIGDTFDMWNISYHLLNTLLLVLDMLLNSITIRWEHLILMLSWFFLYIIFAWGMVGTHILRNWPYTALDTHFSSSLIWYTILYVLAIVLFFVWYGASKLKVCLRGESFKPFLVLDESSASFCSHSQQTEYLQNLESDINPKVEEEMMDAGNLTLLVV